MCSTVTGSYLCYPHLKNKETEAPINNLSSHTSIRYKMKLLTQKPGSRRHIPTLLSQAMYVFMAYEKTAYDFQIT